MGRPLIGTYEEQRRALGAYVSGDLMKLWWPHRGVSGGAWRCRRAECGASGYDHGTRAGHAMTTNHSTEGEER